MPRGRPRPSRPGWRSSRARCRQNGPSARVRSSGRARELELMRSLWNRALVGAPPASRHPGRPARHREVSPLPRDRRARRRRRRANPARTLPALRGASRLPGVLAPRSRGERDPRVGPARTSRARSCSARWSELLPQDEVAETFALSRAPARSGSRRRRPTGPAAVLCGATLHRVRRARPADRLRLRGHPLGTNAARSLCSSTWRSTYATRP